MAPRHELRQVSIFLFQMIRIKYLCFMDFVRVKYAKQLMYTYIIFYLCNQAYYFLAYHFIIVIFQVIKRSSKISSEYLHSFP